MRGNRTATAASRSQTGFEDRPGHQAHAFQVSPLVYYMGCLWRRVRTLTSPVRLVTPEASEYSSQACAYLRLVPRLSRSPAREISPLSLQLGFMRANTASAAWREAERGAPNSAASPRLASRRMAGVGSDAGGSGPAACKS